MHFRFRFADLALAVWVVLGLGCGPQERAQRPELVLPRLEPPSLVSSLSGSLREYVSAIPRMGQQSRDYAPPRAEELALARRAFARLAADRIELAAFLLAGIGFQLLELHDGDSRYFVVREPAGRPIRGWGVYVINPHAERPVALEAPHPQNDLHTGEQALELFEQLGARALLMSTSYRCATVVPSRCSGKTRACGAKRRRGPYRVSDVGHTDRSVFHEAHVALFNSSRAMIMVQLHGFDRRPDRRVHLLISDGTRRRARRTKLSNRLTRLLRKRIRRRRAVLSCNIYGQRQLPPLCGTTNVQGRHANGSVDPCTKRPRRVRNRFIHIEQSIDARLPGGRVEPRELAEALGELIPTRPGTGAMASELKPSARGALRRIPSASP